MKELGIQAPRQGTAIKSHPISVHHVALNGKRDIRGTLSQCATSNLRPYSQLPTGNRVSKRDIISGLQGGNPRWGWDGARPPSPDWTPSTRVHKSEHGHLGLTRAIQPNPVGPTEAGRWPSGGPQVRKNIVAFFRAMNIISHARHVLTSVVVLNMGARIYHPRINISRNVEIYFYEIPNPSQTL